MLPSSVILSSPTSYNGSFTDCKLLSDSYWCIPTHRLDLFSCSADTNQYYAWSSLETILTANFHISLQQVKVLITYFVPNAASGVRLSFIKKNWSVQSSNAFFVNVSANEQQLNVTLPPPTSGTLIDNRILITIVSGMMAINKITFCNEPKG